MAAPTSGAPLPGTPDPARPPRSSKTPGPVNRVTMAGLSGTVIEFYDFSLFASAAALVFGPVFFPRFAPATATLAALGTFATGFLARPLGAALFGHIGDRLGRRAVLRCTVLVTGLATFLVGLLPTYDQVGPAAPVLLVVLRFVQGLGVGGEWTGAVLLATEHAPAARRGLWAGLPQAGPSIGFLLANGGMLALSATLGEHEFLAWGWRCGFWAAGLLTLVGYALRTAVAETPAFRAMAREDALAKVPLARVLRQDGRRVLLVAGSVSCAYAVNYAVTVWALSRTTERLGADRDTMLGCLMVAMALMAAATPFAAACGDRYGRRRLSIAGCAAMAVCSVPYVVLLDSDRPLAIVAGSTLMFLALITTLGVQGAYLPGLFEARVRATGTAVSYNLGAVLGGSLTPLAATALTRLTGHGLPWGVAAYLAGMSLLSLVCFVLLPGDGRRG